MILRLSAVLHNVYSRETSHLTNSSYPRIVFVQ
ncbi:Protein of unknown function [Pyronema omphalodes CBS 100304]|uniref:Uncharacterized protein n=1 Tax=Pyronema omphalodes (strain CBS 100304) TaxID=1076935 RepID=U4LPU8_PYROM|nr:Protein of unknown function [Pyronema omphalodes CBS 100304]